jgi:Protein of unknown function (DUF1592)/Protein of unknown function (DUF1588)/Protein of unknown function (DUF1587)/Protein of unknown function (DUF1595)/Protein of unknown function (DUF1585)
MTQVSGSRARRLRAWSSTLALLSAGCTGYVGPTTSGGSSSSGGANGVAGAGAGTGSTGGGGGNGGNGGSVGAGGGNNAAGSGAANVGTSGPRDPGRVTIRRLNRAEYDNTVRDLLGTAQTPGASTFPNDAPQLGFDNIGDLQTLAPVQFALYQVAAESLAAEAMATVPNKVITCDPTTGGATCAQTLIAAIGRRAFRRPLTTAEVTNYTTLMSTAAQLGATPKDQFRTVLEAMLVSPNFLFRPEFDADPTSLTAHLLSPYETASRLSYMVYRSMPDDALFAAAQSGALAQPADVQMQLQRMIADPKGVFGPTFVSMWLGTSAVSTQQFDATMFPTFTPALAGSMDLEVTSFFNEFVQQNEPVTQLLTANFSYIDKNLATLYGVTAPAGTGLSRTTLSSPNRSGLLTMAGVLSVTSYPTRTSVVKRGAWVLSQLLCAPPPPPPPDVPPFPTGMVSGTQAQVLAQHRANPKCAACHASMDNIGLAMENYDAIGAYRTTDNGVAIDPSGMFTGLIAEPTGATGPSFKGAVGLAAAVAADPRFSSCMAQNALSYSIGRAIVLGDTPYLTDIATASKGGTVGVRDMLMNVVASDTFRMRHGEM